MHSAPNEIFSSVIKVLLPMKWIKKNKVHLIVWLIMIVYLLSASQIYSTFFLKNGKPLDRMQQLPAENAEVVFHIDKFETITFDGQEVYEIAGWVFAPTDSNSAQYRKKIILHSVNENLIFPTDIILRKDLNPALSQYSMDLHNAGFDSLISKDALRPGNYRIGFILEDEQGKVKVFKMLNSYIERLPNGLRLIIGE
jgi:hypothetical protein